MFSTVVRASGSTTTSRAAPRQAARISSASECVSGTRAQPGEHDDVVGGRHLGRALRAAPRRRGAARRGRRRSSRGRRRPRRLAHDRRRRSQRKKSERADHRQDELDRLLALQLRLAAAPARACGPRPPRPAGRPRFSRSSASTSGAPLTYGSRHHRHRLARSPPPSRSSGRGTAGRAAGASPSAAGRSRSAGRATARSGRRRSPRPRRTASRRRRRTRSERTRSSRRRARRRGAARPRRRGRSRRSRARAPPGSRPRCPRASRGSRRTRPRSRRGARHRSRRVGRAVVDDEHVGVGQPGQELLEHGGEVPLLVPGGDEDDGVAAGTRGGVLRERSSVSDCSRRRTGLLSSRRRCHERRDAVSGIDAKSDAIYELVEEGSARRAARDRIHVHRGADLAPDGAVPPLLGHAGRHPPQGTRPDGTVTEVRNPSNKCNGMTLRRRPEPARLRARDQLARARARRRRARDARVPLRGQVAEQPERRHASAPTARSTSPTRGTGACPASGSSASASSAGRASSGSRRAAAGELELVVGAGRVTSMPNGLCFSPDESLLYINDTPRRVHQGLRRQRRRHARERPHVLRGHRHRRDRGGHPRRDEVRRAREHLGHGPGRRLGDQRRRRAPRHDRGAREHRQPHLGRRRLAHAVHPVVDVALHDPHARSARAASRTWGRRRLDGRLHPRRRRAAR